MKDVNEIPVDEFKVAIKSMNEFLKGDAEAIINVVGKKKVDVLAAFKEKVEGYINDRKEELPGDVVTFFEAYCEDVAPSSAKKKAAGKPAVKAEKPAKVKKEKVEKSAKVKKEKVVKEKKVRVSRPFEQAIKLISSGKSQMEIFDALKSHFNAPVSCSSFIASIKCMMNALDGNSKKPEGVVAQYANWLKKGSKGDAPTGDANSIYYMKNVWKFYQGE